MLIFGVIEWPSAYFFFWIWAISLVYFLHIYGFGERFDVGRFFLKGKKFSLYQNMVSLQAFPAFVAITFGYHQIFEAGGASWYL